MKKFFCPVVRTICGYCEIEAESLDKAIEIAKGLSGEEADFEDGYSSEVFLVDEIEEV